MHSPLGGSSAYRWFACPGSVSMCMHAPDGSSPEAREGTQAHNVAHALLTGRDTPPGTPPDMLSYVVEYVDYCESINCTRRWVEHSLHLTQVHPDLYGTPDYACYDEATRSLHVVDFKYGKKRVPTAYNHQLWFYAACVMLCLCEPGTVDTITMHIVQPRLWGNPEPPQAITATQLLQWVNGPLYQAAHAALQADAPRNPGEHCHYCPGKLQCPEYKSTLTGPVSAPIPVSNTELAQLLELRNSITRFYDDVAEECRQRMLAGQDIPGYKLIKRYSKSSITDQDAVQDALRNAGYKLPDYLRIESKLKTLTDLKKLNGAYDIIKPYIKRAEVKPDIVPHNAAGEPVLIATKIFKDTTK